jgi:putative ABC transport system permease protein
MFSLDQWQEIFDTIRRNKLRTALTSLSVAWGILMLMLMLGAGTGLQNGVEHSFRDDAINSLWIRSDRTSMPFEGHAVGRAIHFTNYDYDYIKDHLGGVEHITGRFHLRGSLIVSYEAKKSSFDVRSVHPGHRHLENTIVIKGRYLSDLDLEERRKVAVIGAPVADFLFGRDEPLGKWIQINGIQYQVIGTFEDTGGEGELRKIYIPITTAQMAYGGQSRIDQIMFTVGAASEAEGRQIEHNVRELLARRHHFSPDDERALRIRNNLENYGRINAIFIGIRLFVWVVGLGTILAGIVGVSNIMLISVRERTKEIGIRKALGATPRSIVGQIVQEAIFLTAVSGYLGMLLGIAIWELFNRYVPENDYIREPHVDMSVVITATLILVVSGALAGYFPARRAARVDPVVALRDE